MVDDIIRDKEDKSGKENRDIENRSIIRGDAWYEDGNDKDVKELDKAVEFGKLVFLYPTQFLDVVI